MTMRSVTTMSTCCFAGHSKLELENVERIRVKLENELITLIKYCHVTTFYNGGMGDFDYLCARTMKKFKRYYPEIESILVLAYDRDEQKVHDKYGDLFDSTIYPLPEKTFPKQAIPKRNQWMAYNSEFLLAYVEHDHGGAFNTVEYAHHHTNAWVKNLYNLMEH